MSTQRRMLNCNASDQPIIESDYVHVYTYAHYTSKMNIFGKICITITLKIIKQ